MGEIDEGLEGGRRPLEPVAELRKALQRAAPIVRVQPVLEAADRDTAAGFDVMPSIGEAGAEGETAPVRTGIQAEMIIVARSASVISVERFWKKWMRSAKPFATAASRAMLITLSGSTA